MHRRNLLVAIVGSAVFPAFAVAPTAAAAPEIEVWKSATCGCCKDWIKHLEANGFRVKSRDVSESMRREHRSKLGLTEKFASCHTATVGNYAVEGHVPAREIHRLLKERPMAQGLAVPAMPIGSPGMDGPEYGGQKDPYAVLLVRLEGKSTVYQSYP